MVCIESVKYQGLNPFEFRAGLKPTGYGYSEFAPGLNPFEFRAGLKQHPGAAVQAVAVS